MVIINSSTSKTLILCMFTDKINFNKKKQLRKCIWKLKSHNKFNLGVHGESQGHIHKHLATGLNSEECPCQVVSGGSEHKWWSLKEGCVFNQKHFICMNKTLSWEKDIKLPINLCFKTLFLSIVFFGRISKQLSHFLWEKGGKVCFLQIPFHIIKVVSILKLDS